MGKRVVVVGAGYSGILAAKKLAKKFKKDPEVSITIIDRNPFSTMLTELHEVAAGRVDEYSIRMDLKKIFAGRNVNVKLDTVQKIDFDKKVVEGANESYEYDYVVIAAGSKPTFFGIEGAKENTFTLWSYDDAVRLRDHINDVFVKASQEPNLEKRRFLLTFYVVGAGFTGVEMMGELAEYVPVLCDKFSIDPSDVTMVEVDAMPRTVMTLPEKLANKVQNRLEKMGVQIKLNAKVIKVTEDAIHLDINGNIEENPVHTVIWTAGIESTDITAQSGTELEAAQRGGRIETDQYLRAKGREDVYVIGDNTYFVLEGEERPLPQMVENAEQSGGLVAKNIAEQIRGGKNLTAYKPAFHGTMVCIGGRWGTANIKLGKLEFNLVSFFAMFAKHMMNCVYFLQVLGWNKVFSYLKHEIFTIRNRRSFVGGNFSNRTPSFLLFPLRVWLGAIWLFEGIKKVNEGWLAGDPKLSGFFGGAQQWYDSLLGAGGADINAGSSVIGKVVEATQAATTTVVNAGASVVNGAGKIAADVTAGATGAADAVAGATGAGGGEAAGSVLLHWNFLNIIQPIFVTGKPLLESGLEDFAFKIDFNLMTWFVNDVIIPNPQLQVFMQTMVVVMEIGIGLALIVGLFTTMAAGMSVVLQMMFLMTTGLYLNTVWMVVAGIALIFGGNTLSLDYWVMPKLKKWWSGIPFVKKWYIYHD
ncbi:FAD-dependent oxidoreductase [Erysipelothrix sp. HDW6B]|uniref:FAD-dependent oxidoreductase n=1 Tax=Erysipelothrix TaxID=1647 RepID=UPI00135AF909|nr:MULTISPECIES: FAD-dependent oxidoreductase [Erysipelothrix]QIK85478.1 FAD-dependent oxidoreductase [Erysipelothrix sp. HDW6B]